MSLDSLMDRILGKMQQAHRVTTPQGGAAGGFKKVVRNGKPPAVQVRTDTRRGHHVTLAHGLVVWYRHGLVRGGPPKSFSLQLQRGIAAAKRGCCARSLGCRDGRLA